MPDKNLMQPISYGILIQFDGRGDLDKDLIEPQSGLLNIAGLPVIHHWLNRFSEAGIRHIAIIAAYRLDKLKAYVEDGKRWGFTSVQYHEAPRLANWPEAVRASFRFSRYRCYFASLAAVPTAPADQLGTSAAFWRNFNPEDKNFSPPNKAPVFIIDSLKVFWGLNMKLLLSDTPHLVVNPPIYDSSTRIEGENQFGKNVQLQAQVSIRDSVVGNDVHIGQNTLIKQCVILDNTLIGPSLQLERKVISGAYIYDIERDLLLNTDDIDLSTTLNRRDNPAKWQERCVAAVLLLIFSPLLLLGQQETIKLRVLDAKDFSGRPITKSLMLNILHSKNVFLQKTPWLLEVVRGALPLFGPSLCKPFCTSAPGVISADDLKQPAHTKKINLLFKWLGMTLK